MTKDFALHDECFINGNKYNDNELQEESTIREFRIVQKKKMAN